MAASAHVPAGRAKRHRGAFRPALLTGLLLSGLVPAPRIGPIAGASPAPTTHTPAAGSDLSTFAEIHSASLPDYDSCQLKLTYMGAQTKRRSSLAVVSAVRTGGFELTAFAPFQHHGSYSNDSFVGDTLRVTPAELAAFLDAIALHPALQDTTPPPVPHVSLMVLREYGAGALCWEHITGSFAEGDTLFQLVHDALTEPADRATVHRFRHHLVGIRR